MNVYQRSSSGQTSVPYKRIGKHFDLINSNNPSSDAFRSIFPNMLLKDLKYLSFAGLTVVINRQTDTQTGGQTTGRQEMRSPCVALDATMRTKNLVMLNERRCLPMYGNVSHPRCLECHKTQK